MRLIVIFVAFCSLITAYLFGVITTSSIGFFDIKSESLGDWATWAGATSTFLTFVFLIVQNKKISARQDEADRLRDLAPYNESIEKYNQLIFLLNQHCTDKSNELTTIYKLLCNIDGSPRTEAILQYWHRSFRFQRHVTNDSDFQQILQDAIWNIDIQELQSLFHFFSLTKKEVTSIMKIDIKLATYSQEVVLSERFAKQSKSNELDRKVVNECIGNFCRELHSDNYRMKINEEVDSLNTLRQEFDQLTQLYGIEKDATKKKELQSNIRQLLCIPIIKLIHQYFQYFEMLTKEVALLEGALFYLEKNYGKDEYTKSKNIKGAHTVLLVNPFNLPLLEKISSREVILFELYPIKSK